jgi:hypothetical protein
MEKPEEKRPLGRPRVNWVDNIKISLPLSEFLMIGSTK